MPQVTVYIREDDLDKWKSIEKKADFVSEALNKGISKNNLNDQIKAVQKILTDAPVPIKNRRVLFAPVSLPTVPLTHPVLKPLKSNKDLGEVINIPKVSSLRTDNGTCKKHGTPLTAQGKCLQKGH